MHAKKLIRFGQVVATLLLAAGGLLYTTSCGGGGQSLNIEGDYELIDALDFYMIAPGVWKKEVSTNNIPNTVYRGVSGNRRLVVSRHPLKVGKTKEERLDAMRELLMLYAETEQELSPGMKVEIWPQDPYYVEDMDMSIGGLKVIIAGRGRMVYSRLICRDSMSYNIYYEIFGISAEPDHEQISLDFANIVNTARIKAR